MIPVYRLHVSDMIPFKSRFMNVRLYGFQKYKSKIHYLNYPKQDQSIKTDHGKEKHHMMLV